MASSTSRSGSAPGWPPRQGKSGLGLEGQQAAVTAYLNGGNWSLAWEFVEVESGAHCERPQMAEAIKACRVYGAKLLIAKLDRLSRDAVFLLSLEKAGIEFMAADMPTANRLTVGIMAMAAEEERRMISARTRAALQAAKAHGVKLGGYRGHDMPAHAAVASLKARRARAAVRGADLAPIVAELEAEGVTSLSGLAKALSARGVPAARGGSDWSPSQVRRLLAQIGA